MGLDFGFYRQDETEAFGFRNHNDFFDLLCSRPLVRIEPYTDFYVTRPMVSSMLKDIEDEMRAEGLLLCALPEPGTDAFVVQLDAVPMDFFWEEPDNWQAALPIYRIILANLLEEIKSDGCLICGWSA